MATPRQTWALFCGTGLDCRNADLSVDEASMLITAMKEGHDIVPALMAKGATGKAKAPKQDWAPVWAEAMQAGLAAGNRHKPTPMVVCKHASPLDDNSPIIRQYAPVEGGVCGFAWVKFPGNTSFGKWAKKQGYVRSSYGGGLSYWVSQFGQSMERKEEFARAMAIVLKSHGINAYAGSRMD